MLMEANIKICVVGSLTPADLVDSMPDVKLLHLADIVKEALDYLNFAAARKPDDETVSNTAAKTQAKKGKPHY